ERSRNMLITSGGSSEDRITNSFSGTTGLVAVNQSAGSFNQQVNVMAIGLGATIGPGDLLGDSALATVSGASSNSLQQGAPRASSDVIDNSFTGFSGIAQVSQSAGDLNVIGNTLAISVTEMTLP